MDGIITPDNNCGIKQKGSILNSGISNERVLISCPLCESLKFNKIMSPSKIENNPEKLYGAASGVPGVQTLVKCNNCGLIYENPVFPEEVIIEGYKKSEESGHDSQYHLRVKSFYNALKKSAKLLPEPGAKVLDIGTAGGAFLDAAKSFGYDAYGMEPSSYLVEHGKKRGLKIERGTIDNHNFQEKTFDMVCFWDVIEHLARPKDALNVAFKLLKDDGVLLLNYPDIGTWQAKVANKRFWWILSVHLTHFSRKTISDLAGRTGFKVTRFSRYWQMLEFGYLMNIAKILKVPLSSLFIKITPKFIKNITIPYYASQTTAIARKIKK